jgi:hypothetical protein
MIRHLLRNAGIRPKSWLSLIGDWRRYSRDRAAFQSILKNDGFPFGSELPILGEWREDSAHLGAYFFQDQVVARWIHEAKPERHIDIGSRIDGFVGNLAVFREVEVIDIRPLSLGIRNVRFHQLDLMQEIPAEWRECTDSLSCLHTIEHFGLGRYGDPIDPEGHLKGLDQLKKMVKPKGILYLSTQIGPQRIEFNAHRIFSPSTVISWFSDGWEIEKSVVIDDNRNVTESKGREILAGATCQTGVGIVSVRKLE